MSTRHTFAEPLVEINFSLGIVMDKQDVLGIVESIIAEGMDWVEAEMLVEEKFKSTNSASRAIALLEEFRNIDTFANSIHFREQLSYWLNDVRSYLEQRQA